MLREFPPVVVAKTYCRVVVVVMVMVMEGLMICTLMIPDPGLLTKAYVQQGVQSSPVWTPIALPTTALIKFGIRLPLRRGPLS